MPDKNTCILSYTNTNDAMQDLEKLRAQNFNMSIVSMVGNGRDKKEHNIGIYNKDEKSYFQGSQAMFWESLWCSLDDRIFILLPELTSLTAAGSIVSLLIKEPVNVDIHGFNVLGIALFNMGVLTENIVQYEAAIKAGKILLIVNGKRNEVEQCCEILHSEKQQATVHLA